MRLKSYLKGLGIGITITALILILAGAAKGKKMTDADVVKRAKELGYVESTTLTSPSAQTGIEEKETVENKEEKKEEIAKVEDDKKEEDKETDKNTAEENKEEKDKTSEDTPKVEENKEENKEEVKEEKKEEVKETTPPSNTSDYVIVTVRSGQGSEEAARAAKAAGLITDEVDFNNYMCANGYDRKLNVGDHEIPAGADYETICKALCNMQ